MEDIKKMTGRLGESSAAIAFADELISGNYSDFRAIALHELNADDDAANDCMMLLLTVAREKAEKIQRHPNPTGFLYKTLRYCIMKQRERMSTKKVETVDISLFESVLYSYGSIDDPDIEEILDAKVYVLSMLTETEYALYRMFYVDEMKVSQIAEILHITENAVKVRLHRLRAKIQMLADDIF